MQDEKVKQTIEGSVEEVRDTVASSVIPASDNVRSEGSGSEVTNGGAVHDQIEVCGFLLAPAQPGVVHIDAVYCQNHKPCPLHTSEAPGAVCGKCGKQKANATDAIAMSVIGLRCACGRPTKYTEEMLAKAQEYVNLKMPCKDTDEVVHSIAGLAVYLGLNRDTLKEWNKDSEKPEFSAIYEQIMAKQETTLVNKGLNQVFGGTITKLMLTKHGYRDSSESITREVPIDPEAKKRSDEAIEEYLKSNKQ